MTGGGRVARFGFLAAFGKKLVSGFTVDGFIVTTTHGTIGHDRSALGIGRRTDAPRWRRDQCALDDAGRSFFLQCRDKRLADTQSGDDVFGVEGRVLAECFSGGPHGFLVARCEGTQRMLHTIAKLREHGVGHIERILRDEINADAFGTDEAHDAFDALQQGFWRIVEQEMRFVKEEDELGAVEIADLGKLFEKFRQHPQKERRIEARVIHQLVGGENIDDAATVAIDTHEVRNFQTRLTEEIGGLLVFQDQQLPLDGAH